MSQQYGTKDLMRIQDIRKKADGDFIEEVKLALRMANEIELPGKAIARGYASIAVYKSQYSPIAGIFFERACSLTGETSILNIKSEASMNSVKGDDEAIEAAFMEIPTEKQPASRRPPETHEKFPTHTKRSFSDLLPLEKINVVKGTGKHFDIRQIKTGTIEVWRSSEEKVRIIYTGLSMPTSSIGDQKDFKIDGRMETWTMVDYIEVQNMMNLMPLYGTSITGYMYN